MRRTLTTLLVLGYTSVTQAGSFMETGPLTSQPIGHWDFCHVYEEDCQSVAEAAPLQLTASLWQTILNINSSVNMVIEPKSDYDIYGKEEVWTYPDTAGDCEDYVLLKRRQLIKEELPESDLLITVVRKSDGEGHAVLTVRTDRGDFILDNLTNTVSLWNDTEYTYLKRQAENHAGRWVHIETPDDMLTASTEE